MKYLVTGKLYSDRFWFGKSFTTTSQTIEIRPSKYQEPFVVLEGEGEHQRLVCYFAIDASSYEMTHKIVGHKSDAGYRWIRATLRHDNTLFLQTIRFDLQIAIEDIVKFNAEEDKTAQKLLFSASEIVDITALRSADPLELTLQGVTLDLKNLSTDDKTSVLSAVFSGVGIARLSPKLKLIAVRLHHYVLPEAMKILVPDAESQKDTYDYVVEQCVGDDENLLKLAEDQWNQKTHDEICSDKHLRILFRDFCYHQSSISRESEEQFSGEIKKLSLDELTRLKENLNQYAPVQPKQNDVKMTSLTSFPIREDLGIIASVYEYDSETLDAEINKFFHVLIKLIDNELDNLNHQVHNFKNIYSDGLRKIDARVYALISLDQTRKLFTDIPSEITFYILSFLAENENVKNKLGDLDYDFIRKNDKSNIYGIMNGYVTTEARILILKSIMKLNNDVCSQEIKIDLLKFILKEQDAKQQESLIKELGGWDAIDFDKRQVEIVFMCLKPEVRKIYRKDFCEKCIKSGVKDYYLKNAEKRLKLYTENYTEYDKKFSKQYPNLHVAFCSITQKFADLMGDDVLPTYIKPEQVKSIVDILHRLLEKIDDLNAPSHYNTTNRLSDGESAMLIFHVAYILEERVCPLEQDSKLRNQLNNRFKLG